MIMRWYYALCGLLITVILGISFNRYVIETEKPDFGHLTNIDTSAYDSNSPEAQTFESFVDFDVSMQTEKYAHSCKNMGLEQLLNYFRAMYTKTSFFKIRPQKELKIPKILHYIWLGRKLPQEYIPFLETFKQNHPDWTFIYWVDNPENYDLGTEFSCDNFNLLEQALHDQKLPGNQIVINVKKLPFENRIFFDEATNYGEKSDILKWEIIYQFGGAYIDVDMESLKALTILHHMYDFYTGIQPLDTNLVQLGAAIFGACPRHPILKHCIDTIKSDRHKQQIVIKTGPIHFTKSFLAEAGNPNRNTIDIALPASYFYPCGYEQRGSDPASWMRPEAFAVHHWAGSWLKPEGFEEGAPSIPTIHQ
jgi:mannosyltransferase OCH1-like enzyme